MENSMPLVSIIIPVYNGENFMRQAIDSALAQTYPNIEVLVINDGSTDKTDEIALSYGDKIRYFKKENGGVSTALNLGIKEMKGEYFSWLSHDDLYTEKKVESEIKAALQFGEPHTIICCNVSQIDKFSKPIKKIKKKVKKLPTNKFISWDKALIHLLDKGVFNGCALLIPKRVFTDFNLKFDEKLRYAQDAFLWYSMFLSGASLVCIEECAVRSRVHAGQLTQRGRDIFKSDILYIAKQLLPFLERINSSRVNYYLVKRYLVLGCYDAAAFLMENSDVSKTFTAFQRIKLSIFKSYGLIRPLIRKAYHLIYNKIKTS